MWWFLSQDGDSSDEEATLPARPTKDRNGAGISSKEELDSSNLIGTEEASKRFKKAERKRMTCIISSSLPRTDCETRSFKTTLCVSAFT
jgi:hypothetical protein